MRLVVWSDDALDDFDEVIAYLTEHSPKSALLVADRLGQAVRNFADMPTGRQGRVVGTHQKVVPRTPYIVAYALADHQVTVLRIVHGSRDWPVGGWPTE